jgi:hypothetical protein
LITRQDKHRRCKLTPTACVCRLAACLPARRSGTQVQPAAFEGIGAFRTEAGALFDIINECRVVGSQLRQRCGPGSGCSGGF